MGMRSITRRYDIFGKFLDESYEEQFLQQSLPPTERTFVNRGATKILDFEKIKKSRTSRNKKLRAFLDQND
jgi:hypothetical protein